MNLRTVSLPLLAALALCSCVIQLPENTGSSASTTPASTSTTPTQSSNTSSQPVTPAPYVVKREAYTGTVGNSKVRAELAFYSNGQVLGNYVSFETGKKYLLKGNNHFADKLVLTESTKDKFGSYRNTSISDLRRSSSSSKVWSGTMRNFDGRNVPVKWTVSS